MIVSEMLLPESRPMPAECRPSPVPVMDQVVALLVAIAVCLLVILGQFDGWDRSSAELVLAVLGIGPVLWFVRFRRNSRARDVRESNPDGLASTDASTSFHSPHPLSVRPTEAWEKTRRWGLALILGNLSLLASMAVADQFGDSPPCLHDEFSYLFQAQTFLAGRISFPCHPSVPDLFDQVHVINHGKFASRYFPGTGLWLAPFQAAGVPHWANWIAGALTTMFVFGIAYELSGDLCGFIAGVVTACAPGMALFGNLLLAGHPTMLGTMGFVYAVLRTMTTRSPRWAFTAGTAFAFAMLCRPLTAAAIAAPFMIWSAVIIRTTPGATTCAVHPAAAPADARARSRIGRRPAAALASAFLGPIVFGCIALLCYNHAITGDGLYSPWTMYNDLYTPRHAYGFGNALQTPTGQRDGFMTAYDAWAQNLTSERALTNASCRLVTSWQWTLGIIPLAMAAVAVLIRPGQRGVGWVVLSSIAAVHAAYFAYWFVGILGWHYVFESLPLWAIVFALASGSLLRSWEGSGRHLLCGWWLAVAVVAAGTNHLGSVDGRVAAIEKGIRFVGSMRQAHAAFRDLLKANVTQLPALVLVEQPPTSMHIDFVTNTPALDAPVLIGRYRAARHTLDEIVGVFPSRSIYLFDERAHTIKCIWPEELTRRSHGDHE